ncbi:DUF1963 domain-containing protein [Streptomyces sp. CA-251251]|uniref:DUF1963 domain-containing protein n=1 Tax=Streptomyces sp. CA-251251 TaxID=3240063 RepID=UPI003D93DC10
MFQKNLAVTGELFRAQAAARNLPPQTVEAFIRGVRPAIHLAESNGPRCVGQRGGDPSLPLGAPVPATPFVFSIDCALLPERATDLPLPPDGQLLFFASVEWDGNGEGITSDAVRYVPAGTPTRPRPSTGPSSTQSPYRQRPLSIVGSGVSVLDSYDFARKQWGEEHDEEQEDLALKLGEVRQRATDPQLLDVSGPIQVGGNAMATELDGLLEAEDGEDWVSLASWTCQDEDLDSIEPATVVWAIQRHGLAALRFDRVFTHQEQ